MGMREWLGKGRKDRIQAEWSCCRWGGGAGTEVKGGEGTGSSCWRRAGVGRVRPQRQARSGTMAVGNEARPSAHVRTPKLQIPSSLALPQKDYTEDQMK